MQYIKEQERKALFDELQKRRGTITKLLDSNGQPVGYIIRCEIKSDSDKKTVVVNISLNAQYELKNSMKKLFKQADLKFFAIKKALAFDVSSISANSSHFVAQYDQADEPLFKTGVSAIVSAIVDNSQLCGCPDYSWDVEPVGEVTLDVDELKKYITSKICGIVNYYKKREFTVLFI